MWWWVLIWTVVVLASLAVLGALTVKLVRQGIALARELETASVRFAEVTERLDDVARAFRPEPSAVFEHPAALRQDARRRSRRPRRR